MDIITLNAPPKGTLSSISSSVCPQLYVAMSAPFLPIEVWVSFFKSSVKNYVIANIEDN